MIVHAGLVARRLQGGWRGVLVQGPSGAGKSDLALRLLQQGWRLVADDQVRLWRSGEGLFGRAPDALHGLIEARGLGVVPAPALPLAEVVLVLRHAPEPERMPAPAHCALLGMARPVVALNLLEAGVPSRLEHALLIAFEQRRSAAPLGLEAEVSVSSALALSGDPSGDGASTGRTTSCKGQSCCRWA